MRNWECFEIDVMLRAQAGFRGGGVVKKTNKTKYLVYFLLLFHFAPVVLSLTSGIHSIPQLLFRVLTGNKLVPDQVFWHWNDDMLHTAALPFRLC